MTAPAQELSESDLLLKQTAHRWIEEQMATLRDELTRGARPLATEALLFCTRDPDDPPRPFAEDESLRLLSMVADNGVMSKAFVAEVHATLRAGLALADAYIFAASPKGSVGDASSVVVSLHFVGELMTQVWIAPLLRKHGARRRSIGTFKRLPDMAANGPDRSAN